jgi:hypothetical protein
MLGSIEITKTTERGGESVVTMLKQYLSIETFFQSSPSDHQYYTRYEQPK